MMTWSRWLLVLFCFFGSAVALAQPPSTSVPFQAAGEENLLRVTMRVDEYPVCPETAPVVTAVVEEAQVCLIVRLPALERCAETAVRMLQVEIAGLAAGSYAVNWFDLREDWTAEEQTTARGSFVAVTVPGTTDPAEDLELTARTWDADDLPVDLYIGQESTCPPLTLQEDPGPPGGVTDVDLGPPGAPGRPTITPVE